MSDTLALDDGIYESDTGWRGMVQQDARGILAASFPVKPPQKWFDDPGLTQLTPLTIQSDGRVFGHIAAWHTSHIGMAGGVRPPRSKSNYAFFRTGAVETAEGQFVDVGQITLAGGHASLEASVPETVAHYDNTKSALMDVAAGEDKHGIWVAGAMRPDVDDIQVRAMRASSVSGDWRPINGKLELVAVCAVNCPGFPIPRARVAGGAPIAMVAAGIEPLIERTLALRAEHDIDEGIRAGLHTFRERLTRIERAILSDGAPLASDQAEDLRRRVHGTSDSAESTEDAFEALRSRVHAAEVAVDVDVEDDPDAALDALRARVHEGLAAEVANEDTPDEDTEWADGLDISVPIAAALRSRVHG